MTTKHTVLLVDDTPANLSLLSNLLKEQYRIKIANCGAKALELANAAPPDIILLDIMMPGMDGYEVCRRLKANPRTRTIPVIFITANAQSDDEVQGLRLGAVDYLTKPVVPAIVLARVSTHIALCVVRRELEQKNLLLSDEKELLEEIVTRMNSASPFDGRHLRHIQKSLEKTAGDLILSAFRADGAQHVLVGDFSGHGLPAAFAGPLTAYIFYSLTGYGRDMRFILTEMNRLLYRQLPTQLYLAASLLEVSADRRRVQIWNYGLPPVLCLGQTPLTVHSAGLPLGLIESMESAEPHALLETQPGMRIFQYTDGITEAASIGQELYGQARLEALVTDIYSQNLPLETVWEALSAHCSALSDDAVMVETAL